MNRREIIAGLGSAAAWPVVAHAQRSERMRRIGVFMNFASDDSEGQARVGAFLQGLQETGWSLGRNMRIDYRWGVGDVDLYRRNAAELVALAPDAILASGVTAAAAVQRVSPTVPIVFASAVDPVGRGVIANLARPDGNATGFMNYEFSLSVKWLELLKQIAPRVRRVAVLRDQDVGAGTSLLAAIQAVARSFGVELSPLGVRNADEIERAVAAFVRAPNGGLIVTSGTQQFMHREFITALAVRHRLPAVYPYRFFITTGGLISYGPDTLDQFRRAAGYVARILKGEQPSDLPVQQATKFEMVLNLKTAKALGLTIPETLLATADEVIQ
jgi:putative tryptophan/tyrosine transport system substrate-binding protein